MEQFYKVGQIVNTHGIRGEVKVLPSTDFTDERFRKGSKLRIFNPENGRTEIVTVERARETKTTLVVQFEGWNDINKVLPYKGWLIQIAASQLSELPEGEYYIHQLVGCTVYMPDGSVLGELVHVLRPGANDVWEVQAPPLANGKKGPVHLIPYIDEVVKSVDVAAKRIDIVPMEGLLE